MEFKTSNHGFGLGIDRSRTHSLQGGCKEAALHCLLTCLVVLLGCQGY